MPKSTSRALGQRRWPSSRLTAVAQERDAKRTEREAEQPEICNGASSSDEELTVSRSSDPNRPRDPALSGRAPSLDG
jgi:hypothetical protein